MMNRLTHHLPHYFKHRLGRQLEELYITVGIQDFALAMMILFEPVYLFQLGYTISHIAWYYAIVYAAYILLIPIGGKVVSRYGPQRAIAVSTFFLVAYYISVLLISVSAPMFWVAPLLLALQKSFYWPGYHTDFIATSDQGDRGKEYAALYSVTTIMYIIGPIIGGVLINVLGFAALFIVGSLLIFVSNIPLLIDRPQSIAYRYSYWDAFRQPFTKRHRRSVLGYLGFGEGVLLMYIWPIFLYQTFKTVLDLGWLSALATLLTTLVTLAVGKLVDNGRWRMVWRAGGALAAVNWVTRLALNGIGAVFVSDTIGKVAENMTVVTSTDITYERAIAERDPLRRAMVYEQGLSFGKVLAATLLAIAAMFFPAFPAAFIIAGIFSLLFFIFK